MGMFKDLELGWVGFIVINIISWGLWWWRKRRSKGLSWLGQGVGFLVG